MSDDILKRGYTGYETMGKPIPGANRRAACEKCGEYGLGEADAVNLVTRMVRLLERGKPHEAIIEGRKNANIDIAGAYKLIDIFMTGKI